MAREIACHSIETSIQVTSQKNSQETSPAFAFHRKLRYTEGKEVQLAALLPITTEDVISRGILVLLEDLDKLVSSRNATQIVGL